MKLLARMLKLGVIGALALTLLGFGARLHPWLELCCHFRLQYAVAALSLIVGLAALRSWPWVVAATLALILDLAVLVPCYVDADQTKGIEPALTVLLSNVHSANRQTQPLLDLVAREKPDVVGVLELTHDWQRRLAPLRKRYPHHVERPQADNFGIALYSSLPLLDKRVLTFAAGDIPSIAATVRLKSGRQIVLLVTHPMPPLFSSEGASLRDTHIDKLADHVRALQLPVLVIGDLNATQFSPIFERLVVRARLRSARQGHGVLPTWPAGLWPMRIPLDHVLHSNKLRTLRIEVGPDVGSDHLPVRATLGLAPADDAP